MRASKCEDLPEIPAPKSVTAKTTTEITTKFREVESTASSDTQADTQDR